MFIWSKWKCHPVQNWTFHSHCDTYLCWWKLCIPKFLLNLIILYKQYYHLHLHVLYCLTCSIPSCNRIFCQVTKMTQVKVCCLSFLGCPCHLFLKFLFVKILTSWVNHLENLEQSLFYLVHWCIYKYQTYDRQNSKQFLALALSYLGSGRELYFQSWTTFMCLFDREFCESFLEKSACVIICKNNSRPSDSLRCFAHNFSCGIAKRKRCTTPMVN